MTIRRAALQLEELGERTLPSGFTFLTPDLMAALHKHAVPANQPSLAGQVDGHATRQMTNPDTGVAWHLNGTGNVSGLGHVHMGGNVHGTGFINNGIATGTLTLYNVHGKVVLQLSSAPLGSNSLPEDFTWTVTKATGRYQNFLNDTGPLQLVMTPNASRTHATFTLSM